MTKRVLSVREIALIAIFSAIIIIQTYTPLGYFRLVAVDFTLIHITVILAACLLGPKIGGFIGGVWGITSWLYSYQTIGPLNPVFHNIFVSILPRIIVGLLAGVIFMILNKKLSTYLSSVIAAIIGTVTNTTLVLSGFYIFGYDVIFNLVNDGTTVNQDIVLTFILSLLGTNTLLEIVAAAIIIPLLLLPLKKITN